MSSIASKAPLLGTWVYTLFTTLLQDWPEFEVLVPSKVSSLLVWLDWLKVTQLACESGLSRAQTTGLSKKPQPSSQTLADVLPNGLGETCEQAGAVVSLPRGSRDEPVVSPRGRQRPPRPQMGPQGKRSRGRAGDGGGGGTLQRVQASAGIH